MRGHDAHQVARWITAVEMPAHEAHHVVSGRIEASRRRLRLSYLERLHRLAVKVVPHDRIGHTERAGDARPEEIRVRVPPAATSAAPSVSQPKLE